MNIIDFVCVFI